MSEEISTHYVKSGYATSDEVVLSTTPTTRVVFRPAVHGGGVRGAVVRQKIGADKTWKDVNEVDFRRIPADCGVLIELDTAATSILFEKLDQLYKIQGQGVPYGDQRFVVAREDQVLLVDDRTRAKAIRELVAQGQSEEFWKLLVDTDSNLATKLAAGQTQLRRHQAIQAFADAIGQHRDDEDFWQRFFQRHPWMLQSAFSAAVFMLGGETYVGGKMPQGRQGKGGVATDFLFSDESTKSFAVVEIKTPGTHLVGSVYRGDRDSGLDNETYSMSPDLSGSIVQTRNQITTAIEYFEGVLGRGFETLNRVHPKGVLVVGLSTGLGERQTASFNHFRQGLYSLTVITFDELLKRLTILYDVDLEGQEP